MEQLEEILNVSTTVSILSGGEESTLEIPEDTTGVLMIGNDPSLIQMEKLTKIRELWEQGLPLMAIDAAASVVGAFYTAHEPIPENETDAEALSQEFMKLGTAHINTGLGLIDASIEPRFLHNNRWGSLFTLAFNHPELVTLGLNQDTTCISNRETVMIEGDNGVISLDLRNSDIAPGANGGYIFANGLIDIFSPGEILRFQNAKSGDTFIHAATPLIPSSTPTNTRIITSTTTPKPTRTPRPPRQSRNDILDTPTRKPTRTPIPTPFIPPPTDTNLTSAIIIVGVFAVIAVFLGYWLNRRYL